MTIKNYLICLLVLTTLTMAYSQKNDDEYKSKIATALENYFDLEREAIHLHLDKTSFINNESVWFQGYVMNRKSNKPYFTTNVYLVLYDENGNQISEKLQYASNGIFFGKIDLGLKLKSGQYYIQAYTNWMNNFGENESTIAKITVINPNEGFKNYKKINTESLEIKLNPEGKSYVAGIPNQVGIQLKDCRGNSPENIEATLLNEQNEVIKVIKLNKFGFGKFEIIPTNTKVKVSLKYNDKVIEKNLPIPEETGYTLDVNNFTIEGKTVIKLRTNTTTANEKQSKKKYLVVHQDQKYNLYEITFDTATNEKTLVLSNTDLFEGVNTIRIIDSDLKQWAERLIYFSSKKESNITIVKNNKSAGKLNFVGYSPYPNSNLSIAILPENTKSWDNTSIIAGMTINPYLTKPLENASYYINNPNRTQRYELDLVLLNQEQLKYDWGSIKISPPKANYTFDIGITLKGNVDAAIPNKTFHKTKLVSFKDFIMMQSDINDKGAYAFDHILLADSTFVNMSLQKLPDFEIVKTVIRPQVIGRKRAFNIPFKVANSVCSDQDSIEYLTNFDMPKFSANVIQLAEVKLESKKRKLAYENRIGNGNLRAFKIDEKVYFRDILSFIEVNGFTVIRNRGDVQIFTRTQGVVNGGQKSPEVYVDERRLFSLDELDMMTSDEVDEVYLNPNAIVASMNNNQGIIKIYRKKNNPASFKQKPDPNSFYIKDGFARYFGFKNADYEMTRTTGFDNYGLIDWFPKMMSDQSGQFLFDITNLNVENGKLIIEGMTGDGQFFHEEKNIELK